MVTKEFIDKTRRLYREEHGTTLELAYFGRIMKRLDNLHSLAKQVEKDRDIQDESRLRQEHFLLSMEIIQSLTMAEGGTSGVPEHYTHLYRFASDKLVAIESLYEDLLALPEIRSQVKTA